MGEDCQGERRHNRELDIMRDVLHYDRVPKERADTRLEKFAECSFQVKLRDGRVVEMRGVYSGCDVSMEALRSSNKSGGECKVRKVPWRFVIDREVESVIENMGLKTVSNKFVGVAFNLNCEDCMSRDPYKCPPRRQFQSVEEWLGGASSSKKRQRDETDDATFKKAKAEVETEPDACAQATAVPSPLTNCVCVVTIN